MSRGLSLRDISRAEGNLEVGGDVQPNASRLEAVYGHSPIINPSLGMYREIHPCRASSIGSVKINTSPPMMRECSILHLIILYSSLPTLYHRFFIFTSTYFTFTPFFQHLKLLTFIGFEHCSGPPLIFQY